MRKALLALVLFLVSLPPAVGAQDRGTLGFGRLFSNDALADGEDRWRTGSYVISMVRGPAWTGSLPPQAGAVLEYRFRGEIIAPENLSAPDPDDRRYAGILSIGAHTHFAPGGYEVRLGADLVGVGPDTGVGDFQRNVRDFLGFRKPDLSDQIGNDLYLTVSGEVGREVTLGDSRLRPFVEAQAGVESFIRGGFDMTFGSFGEGGLMLRDVTTGQRYAGIRDPGPAGVSFLIGADIAHVFDSAYLPDGGEAVLSETRGRVRGGINWRGQGAEVFYGVTWLSEEFESQSEGQFVGSIRVNLQF